MEALLSKNVGVKPEDDLSKQVASALESGSPQEVSGDGCNDAIRTFFATKVPWRARVMSLALVVGLLCGVVACLYEIVMDWVIEKVWQEGGPAYASHVAALGLPDWSFILLVCTVLGGMVRMLSARSH